jgi:hypothetical protein
MNMNKKQLVALGLVAAISMLGTSAFAGVLPLPANLLKAPYLTYPGVTSEMQIQWQDSVSQTDTIVWGTDTTYSLGSASVPNQGAQPQNSGIGTAAAWTALAAAQASNNQHFFTFTGLTPNTMYYYQVTGANGLVYGTGSFMTAPPVGQTHVKFMAAGDSRSQPTALAGDMQELSHLYSGPTAIDPEYQRLLLLNGDWVSTDANANWTSEYFTNDSDIVNLSANVPLNGAKGNHDNTSGYSNWFGMYESFPYMNYNLVATSTGSANKTAGGIQVPELNDLYGSFDYGPVHFTFVDEYTSNFSAGQQQYNWIAADLAAANANPNTPWKILVLHESPYSAGADGDNTTARGLDTLVQQYGVDMEYSGHSHNYCRAGVYNTTPAGSTIAPGVPYITSGAGGAPLYAVDLTNTGSWPYVLTASSQYEIMTFDVEGNTLTATSYAVNGVSTSTYPTLTTRTPIETLVLHHFSVNATPNVTATNDALVYSRATKQFTTNLTITNNGPALTGNVDVVLDGMLNLQGIGSTFAGPAYTGAHGTVVGTIPPTVAPIIAANTGLVTNVMLTNATGSHNGEPLINVSTTGLATGASVTVPLTFSVPANFNVTGFNPATAKITFNPLTYQE